MNPLCQVTIPGKIMLAGEYSVLTGGRALACAVNRYMRVTLSSADAPGIHIQSDLWKDDTVTLLADQNPNSLPSYMQPAFLSVRRAQELVPMAAKDCHLTIQCDYPSSYGLGSSSALYLGIITAFFRAHDIQESPLKAARDLQQSSQNFASGYDIWTQQTGGIVVYSHDQVQSLTPDCDSYFSVFVGGEGASTAQIVPTTYDWLLKQDKLQELSRYNELLISLGTTLMAKYDEDIELEFFTVMRKQQTILASSPAANRFILELMELPGAFVNWATKTTGAGGEDAILVFGRAPRRLPAESKLEELGWRRLSVSIATTGALSS